ncbi:hypothetical protein MauCBS54593_001062 [Microsporum audouinii]
MQFKAVILSAFMAGAAIAAPANSTSQGRAGSSSGSGNAAGLPSFPKSPSGGTPTIPGIPSLPSLGSAPDCEKLVRSIASCAAKGDLVKVLICARTNVPTACKCYEELPKGQLTLPFIDQICSIAAPGQGSGSV